MAASTPTSSIQYDNESSGGAVKTAATNHGVLHMYKCTYVFTGAGNPTAFPIGMLPAGSITVFPALSWLNCDDAAATADLDVGYGAFVNEDGTAVVADPNGWFDSVDIGTAAKYIPWTGTGGILTTGPVQYNSKEGIPVTISSDTADQEVGDVVDVYVAYVLHG